MTKGLFLDLDGTIIKTASGETFPKHNGDWVIKEGMIDTIKLFHSTGYKIIIVTNQGGIESKYITEDKFIDKIERICGVLEGYLDTPEQVISYFFCPAMSSYNRKPNPGMAYEAALEFDLDLPASMMVGDMVSDRDFAQNSGIGTFVWAEDFAR